MKVSPAQNEHPKLKAVVNDLGSGRVHVTFTNDSDSRAYLYKPNIPDHTPLVNNVFHVVEGNREDDYKGIYAKRPAPEPEDFETLGPHERRECDVDLTQSYELGGGPYRVWYEAYHDDPGDKKANWRLVSNVASVGGR